MSENDKNIEVIDIPPFEELKEDNLESKSEDYVNLEEEIVELPPPPPPLELEELVQVSNAEDIAENEEESEENTLDNDETDLTAKSSITHSAIEELKSKLVTKEVDVDGANNMIPESEKKTNDHHNNHHAPHLSEDGLIIPKKPLNPVKENPERQNLHRELVFNQKIGKNVLNQKSELQKVFQKQKQNLAKKELENNIQTPELEKVIAERAKKLEEKSNDSHNEDDKVLNSEFLQARMKLKTRTDNK